MGCCRCIYIIWTALYINHKGVDIETHEAAMSRLLAVLKMSEPDLYRTRQELIDEACERQERRIAYANEEQEVEALQ